MLDDLDNLRRACFRLQRTVGNVLELSRIETGQLVVKCQKVSLTELVDEVFEELRGLAQEQGNQVFVEIGTDAVIAWADPVLLRHCLTTILDNANRFTRDGENQSPSLNWEDLPADTQSLALIVENPQGIIDPVVHWAIYNISPEKDTLPEGIVRTPHVSGIGTQAINHFCRTGYDGPCAMDESGNCSTR